MLGIKIFRMKSKMNEFEKLEVNATQKKNVSLQSSFDSKLGAAANTRERQKPPNCDIDTTSVESAGEKLR